MKKKLLNENGSTMAILIIVLASTISLGLLSLNIVMSQYQIKKTNSEIKKALYISEDGLNRAYLRVYNLILDACEDSLYEANEYLLINPNNIVEASNLFKNKYKLYILNNATNEIQNAENPVIEVLDLNKLIFINEKLIIKVKSKYLSKTNVEKVTRASFIILVPEYMDVKSGSYNYSDLLYIDSYDY